MAKIMIGVRLEQTTFNVIDKFAASVGLTTSELMRALLESCAERPATIDYTLKTKFNRQRVATTDPI